MPEPAAAPPPAPATGPAAPIGRARTDQGWFALRRPIPLWLQALLSALCIAACFGVWWYATAGEPEERILSPLELASPKDTFASFESLWFERELTRNTYTTLRRVTLGFGLAAVVGIPLGVLAGCFPWASALLAPLMIFGRNIPIAALIGLTFSIFGISEFQKVIFIFIACVAFVVTDTARAVMDVGNQYIDTAYTLGAGRRQIILKVLVPLAMPSVFNSLRLLFGLAFGYIMLAELVKLGDEAGGLGNIINVSARQGPREHILLILIIIPVVALAIDRLLFWIQRELFPHRYGGAGLLNQGLRLLLHRGEDLKGLLFNPATTAEGKKP